MKSSTKDHEGRRGSTARDEGEASRSGSRRDRANGDVDNERGRGKEDSRRREHVDEERSNGRDSKRRRRSRSRSRSSSQQRRHVKAKDTRGKERGGGDRNRAQEGGGKRVDGDDLAGGGKGGGSASAAVGGKGKEKVAPVARANILVDQPATVTGRTGGVYIPPFKLAQMQKEAAVMGKATKEYQRIAWEALRKSINGLINKVGALRVGCIPGYIMFYFLVAQHCK